MHRHPTFKADFDTGDMEVQQDNGGGGHGHQHDPSSRVFEEEESVYVDSKRMHRLPPIPASALPPLMPPAPPFPTASSENFAPNRPMNLNYTKPSDGTMFSVTSNSQDAGSASHSASQSASQSHSRSASRSQSQSASQSQSQSAASPYDSVPVYAVVATPVNDEMADMSTLGHERRKNKKIMTCLVVSVLLVVGLAVAVGLLVSSKKAGRAAAGNANAITSSGDGGGQGGGDGGDGDGDGQVGKAGDGTDPPTGAPFPDDPLFFDETPTTSPVTAPSVSPTTSKVPTSSPTRRPTHAPNFVRVPTVAPTRSPTREPTPNPSAKPTPRPTRKPTPAPVPVTPSPTHAPQDFPTTGHPTRSPTKKPTMVPTRSPTLRPSPAPIREPTKNPTKDPSPSPVKSPTTEQPTPEPEKETDEPTPAPVVVVVVVDTEVPTRSPVTKEPTDPPPPDTDSPTPSPPVTDAPVASPPPPPEETAPPDPTPPPTVLIVNRLPPRPGGELQTSDFKDFDEKKSRAANMFKAGAVGSGVRLDFMDFHVSTRAGDNVAISVWTRDGAAVGDLAKIKNLNGWTKVVAKRIVPSNGPEKRTPVPLSVTICRGKTVAFYVKAEAAASQGAKKGKAGKTKMLSTPLSNRLFVSGNQVKNSELVVHAGIATDDVGKKAAKDPVRWNGVMRYVPDPC